MIVWIVLYSNPHHGNNIEDYISANPLQVLLMARFSVLAWALLSGVTSIMLLELRISLGWVFQVLLRP